MKPKQLLLTIVLVTSVLFGFSQEKQEWKLQMSENANVFDIEISPNGKYALLIGGKSLQIWDLESKKLLRTEDLLKNLYLVKGYKTKKIGKYYDYFYQDNLLYKVLNNKLN